MHTSSHQLVPREHHDHDEGRRTPARVRSAGARRRSCGAEITTRASEPRQRAQHDSMLHAETQIGKANPASVGITILVLLAAVLRLWKASV